MRTAIVQLEEELSRLLDAGQTDAAATLAIRSYGPELLAFLHSRLNDLPAAREAFSWLAEDLWRGMAGFQRKSTVRTWAYAVARNAALRYADRALRERFKAVPISEVSRASALEVQLPSTHSTSDRLTRIREQLDEEEQTLLTMRVDKELSWREVALLFLYGSEAQQAADEALLEREITRLRKRFQLLKQKLKSLAQSTA
jgi:RNA polymerase sigma-70 factor, ECF subfamily